MQYSWMSKETTCTLIWLCSDQMVYEINMSISLGNNYMLHYCVGIFALYPWKYLKFSTAWWRMKVVCTEFDKFLNLPWSDNCGARVEETSILSILSSHFPANKIWQNNNKEENYSRTGQEEADIGAHDCTEIIEVTWPPFMKKVKLWHCLCQIYKNIITEQTNDLKWDVLHSQVIVQQVMIEGIKGPRRWKIHPQNNIELIRERTHS